MAKLKEEPKSEIAKSVLIEFNVNPGIKPKITFKGNFIGPEIKKCYPALVKAYLGFKRDMITKAKGEAHGSAESES